MKKAFITGLLAVGPSFAFAHSAVVCDTSSMIGEVKLTVTSETALSDFFSIVHVVGDGSMRDVDVMAQAESQPTLPGQVVLKLKTLTPGTTEIDPKGAEALLTLKTITISENPLVLQADQIGNLQITKPSADMRRIQGNFVLSNCRGIL